MRRFELVEGKSSKFWEVQAEGCTVTVRLAAWAQMGKRRPRHLPMKRRR